MPSLRLWSEFHRKRSIALLPSTIHGAPSVVRRFLFVQSNLLIIQHYCCELRKYCTQSREEYSE